MANISTINPWIFVVLGVICAIFLSIGIYYLLRFIKGSVKIQLNTGIINYSQPIIGTAEIKARMNVDVEKIVVAVVGERLERRRTSKGTSSSWQEFYRTETLLSSKKNITPGTNPIFNFTVRAPESNRALNINTDNKIANFMVNTLSSFITGKVRWSIQVRVYAKGIDLFGKKYFTVYEKAQAIAN